jgi:hypothetical protein
MVFFGWYLVQNSQNSKSLKFGILIFFAAILLSCPETLRKSLLLYFYYNGSIKILIFFNFSIFDGLTKVQEMQKTLKLFQKLKIPIPCCKACSKT